MSGNWIELLEGGGYDFETKEIFGPFSVAGLAIPLSTIPRYVGNTRIPVSVAAHSLAGAYTVMKLYGNREMAAAELIHDAHEVVTGDIPTPVARAIDGQDYIHIKQLKHDVQMAIELELNIPARYSPTRYHTIISTIDRAALHVERMNYKRASTREWTYEVPNEAYIRAYESCLLSLDAQDALWGDECAGRFERAYDILINGPESAVAMLDVPVMIHTPWGDQHVRVPQLRMVA